MPTQPDLWCILWLPPNADYLQMSSNCPSEQDARRQAEFLKDRGFTIVAVVSQARIVSTFTQS